MNPVDSELATVKKDWHFVELNSLLREAEDSLTAVHDSIYMPKSDLPTA